MSAELLIYQCLEHHEANEALTSMASALADSLPPGEYFERDTWDLLAWLTRKGSKTTYNVHFEGVRHLELRKLVKIYILEKRLTRQLSGSSAKAILPSLTYLGEVLGARPVNALTNASFIAAQEIIVERHTKTTPARHSGFLQSFGRWLASNFGLRISYTSTLITTYLHGRQATDAERDAKRIDNRILKQLMEANQRNDLISKDRFYLSVLALFVGTGIRIGELATLPKDCLICEQDRVGLRHFPEKKPQLDVHFVVTKFAPVVVRAISELIPLTDLGREAAKARMESPGTDWTKVLRNPGATSYFVAKFCHEWTAKPVHFMFNKDGAWCESLKKYVDVVKGVEEAGSQVKAAKQLGVDRSTYKALLLSQQAAQRNQLPSTMKSKGSKTRASWDTDSRVISISQLEKAINKSLSQNARKVLRPLIYNARDNYQLLGDVYPSPLYDADLEKCYQRVIHPLIESKAGAPILQPDEGLLIIPQYALVDSRGTKVNDYSLVDVTKISRWLCGEKRSLGTKNVEDSCFSRLGIIDPETGEIAKFTSHDIRHWLTTYFLEGGMASDQVGLLFNRASDQNDTYDQTSSKTRLNNMRAAIRDGGAMGHVADTYKEIAEYSREEAESYLAACTLQLNLMPHGGCSLNWGMEACPNHNSCFNGEEGLCEHLCINPDDQGEVVELTRMARETETALRIIPEASPQYSHYKNIQKNLIPLVTKDN